MLRKSPLSPRRISARDRRRAAVHEAGHLVMARHLGIVNLGAEIHKIQPRDIYEKEWIGSFRHSTFQIPECLSGNILNHRNHL
jgi:hypothetical protein